ncbi:hypothetical protein K474DRAFT_1706193 [Panus rudis PR-1116 ss-1]|nr:hypothetical protein K474DRAFT_1706193 [Panus rudis PR-1116 ss-1]
MANYRRHPHLSIPTGAAPPTNPSPVTDQWNFLVTPPPNNDPLNLWSNDPNNSSFALASPDSAYPLSPSFPEPDLSAASSSRPPSRAASAYESRSNRYSTQEASLHRSSSQRATLRPSPSQRSLGHRGTRSEVNINVSERSMSRPPSFVESVESSPELPSAELSEELSNLTLESEEGLRKFQNYELAESDREWYRLVPAAAREVLDKKEVQRQSNIFEIIKSEQEYVRDLELVNDIFVEPMLNTLPIPQQRVKGFIHTVFYNLNEILLHHRKLRDALFEIQREEHPLIQSIAAPILQATVEFQTAYDKYIEHYPIAEAQHRTELRTNTKYQYFLNQCSQDPRVRKRDLITFLSRPVTRLPRLLLQLETMLKHTEPDHPDQDPESVPFILNMLNNFIRSTQPKIQTAETKVKFWALCESLLYQKGEIIDLDLYNEGRNLRFSGTLARRYRDSNVGTYQWADLHTALLDNYLLILKPELRSHGQVKNVVVSRPIPLEYLRLASFNAEPVQRKEKSSSQDITTPSSRSLLESLSIRSRYRNMYPFTVYHASAKHIRSYTLYAASEAERKKWYEELNEAIALRRLNQDANKFFAMQTLNDYYFKTHGLTPHGVIGGHRLTGKINCATPIYYKKQRHLAVGCPSGVYFLDRSRQDHVKKVLQLPSPISLHTIPTHNKLLVQSDAGLQSFSLDLFARVGLDESPPQPLDASLEKLSGPDTAVDFVKVARFNGQYIVLYATRSFLQVNLHLVRPLQPGEISLARRKSITGTALSYKPYKPPISIPKDVHGVTALRKSIGICAERGIHIFDPEKLGAMHAVVPDFSAADSNPPMHLLKTRCSNAKPLGMIKCGDNELLVVFDELGCYVDRHGFPTRSCGYLRWETKATSYAHRGDHILLFSPEFIEIRTIRTGKLVQVMEGQDIRMVHEGDTLLVAMRGKKTTLGVNPQVVATEDKLVELVETAELGGMDGQVNSPAMWDEWDM